MKTIKTKIDKNTSVIVTRCGILYIANNKLSDINIDKNIIYSIKKDGSLTYATKPYEIEEKIKLAREYRLLVNEDGFNDYFYEKDADAKYIFDKEGNVIGIYTEDQNQLINTKKECIGSILKITDIADIYEQYNITGKENDLYNIRVKRYVRK